MPCLENKREPGIYVELSKAEYNVLRPQLSREVYFVDRHDLKDIARSSYSHSPPETPEKHECDPIMRMILIRAAPIFKDEESLQYAMSGNFKNHINLLHSLTIAFRTSGQPHEPSFTQVACKLHEAFLMLPMTQIVERLESHYGMKRAEIMSSFLQAIDSAKNLQAQNESQRD